jgi:hypothetical protein
MLRIATLSVCVCAIPCFGQPGSALENLRALNLPVMEGTVPAIYSRSAKARAALYRSALETAHRWYEAQLGIQVPATLAVLDEHDWKRASRVPYPMPNAMAGLVSVPSRMEDFPGFAEMRVDAVILTETISFHEMGHLFAGHEGIRAGNPWVNELVANIFAQEYIQAHQPLLRAYLADPHAEAETPRYTSLADLDYLEHDGVSFSNYAWFQFRLNKLASLLAQKRNLRSLVEQLKVDFPAAQSDLLSLLEIVRRLENIAPGFSEALGPLSKPTTIARNQESACVEPSPRNSAVTYLIIDNRSASELVVTREGQSPIHLAGHRWRRLRVRVGEQVELSNGGCVVASNEPSLAVVERP